MASLVFSRFFSLLVLDLVMFATYEYEYKYYFLKKKKKRGRPAGRDAIQAAS